MAMSSHLDGAYHVIDERVSGGDDEIICSGTPVKLLDFHSWKFACVFANNSIRTERVSRLEILHFPMTEQQSLVVIK